MSNIPELEKKVKELIKQSLRKQIEGLGRIDPDLDNETLVKRWLTDIMAIGFNHSDLALASNDIYEMMKPLEGVTVPLVLMEDIRNRVHHSQDRFYAEIDAFTRYVDLRSEKSEEIVLYEVSKELEDVTAGELEVI